MGGSARNASGPPARRGRERQHRSGRRRPGEVRRPHHRGARRPGEGTRGQGGAPGPVAEHPTLPAGPARVLHRSHGVPIGARGSWRARQLGRRPAMGRSPDAAGADDAPGRDGPPARRDTVPAIRRSTGRAPPADGPHSKRRHASPRGRPGAAEPQGSHLHHVRLQRAVSRPAHRGRAGVGADRHLPQPAAACVHRALARPSARLPERRRAGPLPARGAARRTLHLSPSLSRRGDLLVSPARPGGYPAGARPLRQHAGPAGLGRPVRSGQSRGRAHARRHPGQ